MAKAFNSFGEFKNELMKNHDLQEQFRKDPKAAVSQYTQKSPLESDEWIYRIIVLALGGAILFIILGVIILISIGKITNDNGVPTILTAIGSAAIGALAGLLAPPPKGN